MISKTWTAIRLGTRIMYSVPSQISCLAVRRAERAKASNVNQPRALAKHWQRRGDIKGSALGWLADPQRACDLAADHRGSSTVIRRSPPLIPDDAIACNANPW